MVAADLVEVVVLAAGPDALLHGGRPAARRRLLAHEVGLERHHAGDGEQQRRGRAGSGWPTGTTVWPRSAKKPGRRVAQLVGGPWSAGQPTGGSCGPRRSGFDAGRGPAAAPAARLHARPSRCAPASIAVREIRAEGADGRRPWSESDPTPGFSRAAALAAASVAVRSDQRHADGEADHQPDEALGHRAAPFAHASEIAAGRPALAPVAGGQPLAPPGRPP